MIDHYDWAGGREAVLRFGSDSGPVVVAALPLFEEANRTRAFVVTILRLLAERGVTGALPDLPGTGESLVPTEQASLRHWRAAFAAVCAGRRVVSIAFRGGALVDREAECVGRWQFSPMTGERVVRELIRTRQAADREDGIAFDAASLDTPGPAIAFAGNLLSPSLLAELRDAVPPTPARVVRLEGDQQPADLIVPGAPLWRRVEPDNDPTLAALLADDIAGWVRQCGA